MGDCTQTLKLRLHTNLKQFRTHPDDRMEQLSDKLKKLL